MRGLPSLSLSGAKRTARVDTAPCNRQGRQAWTFSSSGWLFVYFFGVIKCLKQHGLNKDVYVVGSSGGACAGTYLFLDAPIEETIEYIKECALRARSGLINATKIREYVAGAISNFTPANAGPQLTGNLEVSVTTLPWFRNVRVKTFGSNEEVRDAVLASACIVPPPLHLPAHGYAMDGAFSDFQILKAMLVGGNFLTMHNEDAISVCPFYMSRADIKPSKWIPPWWAAYPPTPDKLDMLFALGFTDTLTWLKDNDKLTEEQLADLVQPESEASVDEEKSLWRQVVSQTACEAPSCDESLKEAVVGAWGILRSGLGYALWFVICWELFLSSCVSFGSLVVTFFTSPVVGGESLQQSRARFASLCKSSTISSWELLKTIPQYTPQHIQVKDKKVARSLREHSFFYRVFYFILH
ncbi:hypothetical protein WJX82_009808 [Trebouxia sp. C0006]